jgi:6-phosphogluconolactonase
MIVYVASPDSREIHVFRLANERLAPVQVVATPGQAQPMALSADRQHLYAGVRPENGILTYRIAEDGLLQFLAQATVPGSPTYLSVRDDLVFCASYSGNVFSTSPIVDGLARDAQSIFPHIARAHAALTDPSGAFVLVPSLGEDRIHVFRRHTEALIPFGHGQTRAGAGPRHLVFHPCEPVVYCLNELDGHIDLWHFDAHSGALILRDTVSALPPGFAGKPWSADLHLSNDARFLYSCDRTTSTIAVHRVAKDGTALELAGHVATETQPRGFALTRDGQYLIAAGQLSNHVALYQIDAQSGLPALLQRIATGEGPMWVQILDESAR